MNCSSIDLKAYLVGEMAQRDKSLVEDHVRTCQSCREERERLRIAYSALMSLADEEVPQRIAFVSDKVFEPRWWQRIWRSGPAMGFAAASVLAAAILVHGFTRPAGVPAAAASVDTAQIEQRVEREVNARVQSAVNAAVTKAINEADARRDQKFAQVLDAAEKRYELERRVDLAAVQQTIRYYDQQMGRLIVASNDIGQERTSR
jgi:anti-sigma factor RsiW